MIFDIPFSDRINGTLAIFLKYADIHERLLQRFKT